MTINLLTKVKYQIKYTNEFKRNYKKIKKQGKDTEKLILLFRTNHSPFFIY